MASKKINPHICPVALDHAHVWIHPARDARHLAMFSECARCGAYYWHPGDRIILPPQVAIETDP